MSTSSSPVVMFSLPSAVNDPMRAKNVPDTASVPLMKKAYWPFKLASEKLPVGGGGIGVEPPPPQAADSSAKANVDRTTSRFTDFMVRFEVSKFIAHLPARSPTHFSRRRADRLNAPEFRGRNEPQQPAFPPAPGAP